MQDRIATLRGGACLLLVFYHVVGSDPANGLKVEDGLLRMATDWLALIRMPLFAMIAGWCYALNPCRGNGRRGYLLLKARKLLLPMVTVGSAFVVLQMVTPGVSGVFQGIPFVHPVVHYWFVEALFLIFILITMLDANGLLDTFAHWLAAAVIASIVYLFAQPTELFAIAGAVYLLPFFLFGLAMNRFADVFEPLRQRGLQLALAAAVVVQLLLNPVNGDRMSCVCLTAGLVLCLLAAEWCRRNVWLTTLAGYSFSIYLFHNFFTGANRIVLLRFGVDDLPLHLATGLAAGLVGPAVVQIVLKRFPVAGFFLLGQRLPERTFIASMLEALHSAAGMVRGRLVPLVPVHGRANRIERVADGPTTSHTR